MPIYNRTIGTTVNLSQLHDEVEAAAIAPALIGITATGTSHDFDFDSSLSAGEETTLDGVIAAHVAGSIPTGIIKDNFIAKTATSSFTTVTGTNLTVNPGSAATVTSPGNTTVLTGGAGGSTSGAGGAVTLMGGTPTAGAGGSVNIDGANGVGTNQNGGVIDVDAGNATGSGTGGNVTINAGTGGSSGTAGFVTVVGGNGATGGGTGGSATLRGGIGGTASSGGSAIVEGGAGNGGAGGSAQVKGGAGVGAGTGGGVQVTAGTGGTSNGDGGAVTISGGTGFSEGNGGSVTIRGGDNGTGTGNTAGSVTIQGRNASGISTNGNAGGVTIQGGTAVGSGTAGNVSVVAGTSPSGTDGTISFTTNATQCGQFTAAGSLVLGSGALATNATDGFLYVPGSAGAPTGAPTAFTGRTPITIDTTNNLLYWYTNGAWRIPSGTVSQPTNQIVYGTGGAVSSDADFTFDPATNRLAITGTDAEIELAGITNEPSPPAQNRLLFYAKDIGGRMIPKWVGPSGLDTPVQPGFAFNRIMNVAPAAGSTAGSAMQAMGTAFSNSGTLSNPVPTSTNLRTSTRRTNFSTGGTAGAISYNRAQVLECWRGNAAGLGGFFYVVRFSLDTLVAGMRSYFGLVNTTSNPTNIDPTSSTTLAKLGMAINTNSGNWNLVHNSAGAGVTVINLGSNFPVNNTDMFELVLYTPANASSVTYRVSNLSTGNVTSGTLSSNLPANTLFLAPTHWITNNATASAAIMSLHRWYLETDY